MNPFKEAAIKKIRFETKGMLRGITGELMTEDLFQLTLDQLDKLAVDVDNQIKAGAGKSFINKKTSSDEILELKLAILKEVIEDKITERDAKRILEAKKAKAEKLRSVLETKNEEALQNLSKEEIEKMLAELEA